MQKHVYKIALGLLVLWAILMVWDNIYGLPEMSARLKNMLVWFPTLIVGFIWAFSGKKDSE